MIDLQRLAQEGKINEQASLRDRQSIIVNAPIGTVWNVLTSLTEWPDWDTSISKVHAEKVSNGSKFSWHLGKMTVSSEVTVLKEPYTFGYISSIPGSKTIQVWNLEKSSENQTIVTSEISMQGFRTIFYGHQTLNHLLIDWLDKLKKKAES